MGRYRRGRSLHWMSQPRDLNGRFSSFGSGGGGGDDEWFWKLSWWKKVLVLLGTVILLIVLFKTGLLIPLAILGWLIIILGR